MGLSKPIKVSIMGQEYNIRTDADQNYIKKFKDKNLDKNQQHNIVYEN